MITKKLFIKGINSDDAEILIDTNEYINGLNIRFATTENGKVGPVSNVEGNVVKNTTINSGGTTVAFTLPSGVNTTIGAYEDFPNKRVFFFNQNSSGSHGIYCYDSNANRVYTVLLNSQVTDGLGFTTNIHSVSMIGNLLYWTDGVVPQRRINVESGMKLNHPTLYPSAIAYTSPIAQSVINLIRNQPAYPLTVSKAADVSVSNNLRFEAFNFAYRFVYNDNENSVFSPWSDLVNYNFSSESFNAVDITIPTAQKIEQDVAYIEIAARYALLGKMFVIKTIKSGFAAHNAGTAITFRFFNDTVGYAIDDATALKQYDAVPVTSKALEIAKNRLFLGNSIDGYDTPTSTSLALSTTTGGMGTLEGLWCVLQYDTGFGIGTMYLVDITGIDPNAGYYEPTTPPTPPAYPTSVNYTTLIYRGAGLSNVMSYLGLNLYDIVSFTPGVATATITNFTGSIAGVVNQTVFKSASSYRLGVVFYDYAGRKSGVVTSDSLKVVTGDRDYSGVNYLTNINWALTNSTTPSVRQAEIPSWAYYYQVVMTKCLRTNFFMQMRASSVQYAIKAADGTYTFSSTYNETRSGIAVKVDLLSKYQMGYSYQEGDLMKLYGSDTTIRTLNIKDTYSDYVIVDLVDLGTIVNYLFEIYTPYSESANEAYYEYGKVYPINSPGTASRAYSTVTGSYKGDVVILQRSYSSNSFNAEAMSPNDLVWKVWNTNGGRKNFIVSSKSSNKKTTVSFSNVILLGSQTNGLSSFDVLDQVQLPIELASIQRLMLVSKVEMEGTVMLAIGEQETATIYLGETQVFDNSGTSFLAKSSGVIGNVNVLRGSFGTINPESAAKYMGQVYWFDASKGSVVQYSTNGLFPISSNKMQKYWRKIGQDVLSGGYKVFGGIDPYHNEVLMFAPRKSYIPQNTVLSDMVLSSTNYSYSGSSNVTVSVLPGRTYNIALSGGATATYNGTAITGPFVADETTTIVITAGAAGQFTLSEILRGYYEPYDGQGGVWSYIPSMDRWSTQYSFRPEWMTMVGNRLVTFKNGLPYVHNSTTYNQFYGQTYDSVITFTHNEAGSTTKVYQDLSVEGSCPDIVHTRTETPYEQSSDIRGNEFDLKEGVYYSAIYRDRLSPNATGDYYTKLITGDAMRGDFGKFQVVFSIPTTRKQLNFVNIGFVPSRGHTTANTN